MIASQPLIWSLQRRWRHMLKRPKFGFAPTSRIFALATSAQTIRLWDLDTVQDQGDTEPFARLETDRSAVVGLVVDEPDQLITLHETGLVLGWPLDGLGGEESPGPSWSHDLGVVIDTVSSCVESASGGRRVAIGAAGGEIAVMELVDGQEPRVVTSDEGHNDKVEVTVLAPGALTLATAGRQRDIVIWSLGDDGDLELLPRQRLDDSGGWPLSMSFSDSGRKLVTGAMDNGVYLWDLTSDQPLQSVRFEHHGWVEDVQWAGDDEAILSASWDNSALAFDSQALAPKFQFMYHDDYVVRVLPIPGTSKVFAASYDGNVSVWDWRQGRLVEVLEGHDDWVTDLVWLGNDTVASLSSDRTARLWSATDLECRAVLGQSMARDFEFETSFKRSDFGLDDDRRPIVGASRAELDRRQSKVVRRFEEEPMRTEGGQATALSMLEDAIDDNDVDLGGDGDSADIDGDGGAEHFDSDPKLGEAEQDSLLLEDAGVDTEAGGSDGGHLDDVDAGQAGETGAEALDTTSRAVTQKLDPDELGADDGDDGERSDALSALDAADRDSSEAIAEELGGGDVEISENVDVDDAFDSVDLDSEGEFPDVSDISEEAFDQVHGDAASSADADSAGDVDIMDSVFDPVDGGEDADGVGGAGDGGAGDEGPQSVGSEEDLSQLLPDDDDLDLALSSSVADAIDDADADGGADADADSTEASKRDVDRPPDDVDSSPSSDDEDLSGKAKPSSARGARDGAGGGDNTLQHDESAPGRPEVEASTPASPSSPPTASGTEQGVAMPAAAVDNDVDDPMNPRGAHQTMTPFTSPNDADGEATPMSSTASDAADGPKAEADQSVRRRKLETLSKNLKEKLGNRQPSTDGGASGAASSVGEDRGAGEAGGTASEASDGPPMDANSETTQALRRRRNTTMPGGGPRPNGSPGEPSPEASPARDVESDGPQHSNAGREAASGGEGPSKGLKGRKTGEFHVDDLAPDSQATDGGLEAESDVEAQAARLGDAATRSRLVPGDSVDEDELNIPEPDQGRTVADEETSASSAFETMDWSELWSRSTSTAPPMGVLKPSKPSMGDYGPELRFKTGHRGEMAVALSPKDHRLLSAGKEGEIKLWGDGDAPQLTFKMPGRNWMDVGFIQKERLAYGVARSGVIDLWWMPPAGDDEAQSMGHASVEQTGVRYQCAAISEDEDVLLVGSDSGTAYVWSMADGECVMRLKGHAAPVCEVAFTGRGPVTAGRDNTIRFWNHQGLQIDQIETADEVRGLAPVGDTLMWVEAGGAVRRLAEGGRSTGKLKGHFGDGTTAVARDESTWISGGDDGRILLYSSDSDEPQQEIQVPAPVQRLAVSSRRLIAASADSVIFAFRRN